MSGISIGMGVGLGVCSINGVSCAAKAVHSRLRERSPGTDRILQLYVLPGGGGGGGAIVRVEIMWRSSYSCLSAGLTPRFRQQATSSPTDMDASLSLKALGKRRWGLGDFPLFMGILSRVRLVPKSAVPYRVPELLESLVCLAYGGAAIAALLDAG